MNERMNKAEEKTHGPFLPLPSLPEQGPHLLPRDNRTTISGLLRLNISHSLGSRGPSVLD